MNLVPFSFKGVDIRLITDEHGESWFVGKDVCDLLCYANPSDAMGRHCKGVVKRYPLQTPGGVQDLRILSEGDTLRLIVNSAMPAAQEFESWVFDEVLPTIRKTGSYQRAMTPGEQLLAQAQAVITIERQQAEQQIAIERIERKVEVIAEQRVWDHCPQNCVPLGRIKQSMNKRCGLSGRMVAFVLQQWPHMPKQAGMVRNGHEDAKGSQYVVWHKTDVLAAFNRFVSESQMVTATQATNPYFEGRFRLVQQVQS